MKRRNLFILTPLVLMVIILVCKQLDIIHIFLENFDFKMTISLDLDEIF